MRDHILSYLPDAGDVWFSLNDTTYQNNSLVTLKDIGENDTALLCKINQTACCHQPFSDAIENWFFPNGSDFPSKADQYDLYETRGQSVVSMNRRKGGEEGIYRCEIVVSANITQTIYIGVYNTSTGE